MHRPHTARPLASAAAALLSSLLAAGINATRGRHGPTLPHWTPWRPRSHASRSRYVPHQGKRECLRRKLGGFARPLARFVD